MLEIFVIYDKTTGFISGGCGKIDREWDAANKDGSTTSEYIEKILAEDPNKAVIFLSNSDLPDPEKQVIVKGKITEMTEEQKEIIRQSKIYEQKIQSEIRSQAIKSLREEGEEILLDE